MRKGGPESGAGENQDLCTLTLAPAANQALHFWKIPGLQSLSWYLTRHENRLANLYEVRGRAASTHPSPVHVPVSIVDCCTCKASLFPRWPVRVVGSGPSSGPRPPLFRFFVRCRCPLTLEVGRLNAGKLGLARPCVPRAPIQHEGSNPLLQLNGNPLKVSRASSVMQERDRMRPFR